MLIRLGHDGQNFREPRLILSDIYLVLVVGLPGAIRTLRGCEPIYVPALAASNIDPESGSKYMIDY